ncbi:MAG: hypothetical protein K2X86_18725 [Cytophagaceae bacterium]|nr:hypothetical protein [Cytophagaceae bacterium]
MYFAIFLELSDIVMFKGEQFAESLIVKSVIEEWWLRNIYKDLINFADTPVLTYPPRLVKVISVDAEVVSRTNLYVKEIYEASGGWPKRRNHRVLSPTEAKS